MNRQVYYIYKAASLMKLADDPRYTEEEFNNLVDQYKKDKRGDIPEASSYSDMFNTRLDARQPEIDKANNRLAKSVARANGFGPLATGMGGLVGFGIGGWLADRINGAKPDLDIYTARGKSTEDYKKDFDKWKANRWKRWLIGAGLRGGGFLLGGLLPYAASRGLEGIWDGGAAVGRGIYNRYAGGRK